MLELECDAAARMKFPLRKHCLLVMRDPDYPACTVFAKGLIKVPARIAIVTKAEII